jgi:acetoin utilization deacetylase AcuC-like enzyme
MLKIAFSSVYKYDLPEGHRFPMEKYDLLPQQLLYEETVTEASFFEPEALLDIDILRTHSKEYLDKLNFLTLDRKEIRNIGFPVSEKLISRGKIIAGGTLQCAYEAMSSGVALNIAGGTHHSFRDRGEGFCIFNDFAIAAKIMLHRAQVKKILIIDLDVHQGNGTASIFESDDSVFTFSMHGKKNYPLRKEKSDLDVPLEDGTGDADYLSQLEYHCEPLINKVKPDIIFYLAGVDVLATDKLGRLGMTQQGCKERDIMVLELCKKYNIPVAVSMGGGYSKQLPDIINAHANTFRVAASIF